MFDNFIAGIKYILFGHDIDGDNLSECDMSEIEAMEKEICRNAIEQQFDLPSTFCDC